MKPRWAFQPDDYSCGPTMIINALKWVGTYSYRGNIKEISNRLECSSNGSFINQSVLRDLLGHKYTVRQLPYPLPISKLDAALEDGPVCMSMDVRKLPSGHFFLAVPEVDCFEDYFDMRDKRLFYPLINYSLGSSLTIMNRERIKQLDLKGWGLREK